MGNVQVHAKVTGDATEAFETQAIGSLFLHKHKVEPRNVDVEATYKSFCLQIPHVSCIAFSPSKVFHPWRKCREECL